MMAAPGRAEAFPSRDHDHGHCIADALLRAEEICARKGARLTRIRRSVLAFVWESHAPVGAYGILERLMAVGILAETVRGGRGHAFQLGRPADDIALADILLGLRGERRAVVIGEDEVNDLVEGIIGELRGIESPFVDGRTLSDLMQNLSPREPALGKG